MNVDHENTELGTVMPVHDSPGEMLKRAREAKKLSHIDVAKQLKLRVQWILDIENNHYTDACALIYVRGYLRAYARVVNVSPDAVMSAFDLMKFDEPFVARKAQSPVREEQFVMHQPVLSYKKSKASRGLGKKIWTWIILIVVLLALALTIMWWRSEHNLQNASNTMVSPQVTLPAVSKTSENETGEGVVVQNRADFASASSANDAKSYRVPKNQYYHHNKQENASDEE